MSAIPWENSEKIVSDEVETQSKESQNTQGQVGLSEDTSTPCEVTDALDNVTNAVETVESQVAISMVGETPEEPEANESEPEVVVDTYGEKCKARDLRRAEIRKRAGRSKRSNLFANIDRNTLVKGGAVAGLGVVFLTVISFTVLPMFANPEEPVAPSSSAKASISFNLPKSVAWQLPETFNVTLRDPMAKAATIAQVEPTEVENVKSKEDINRELRELLLVKGLVFNNETQIASVVINGKICTQGDIVEGVLLLVVDREKVIFVKDDVRWTQFVE